jgi:signal transduction histidine kinase
MRRRTLAGRVALVQTVVTLLTLAVVTLATSAVVSTLLTRKTDDVLEQVSARIVGVVGHAQPETLDRESTEKEIQELKPVGMRVEVRDEAGRLRASAGEALVLEGSGIGCADRQVLRACGLPAGLFRVCGVRAGPFTVFTAVDRAPDTNARNRLLLALVAACVVAGVVVTLASRLITRRALAPLSDLATRVAVIEPGAGQRVDLQCDLAELELLETRFDALVERFEDALGRERRLTAQASHELRTPLTIARAEIEGLTRGEHGPRGPERALAALDRLSELVESLLWFARAQSRLDGERMGIVNIADLVRAQISEHRLAEPSLACQLPDEALVRGDEHLLCRIVANLIDNAVKYGEGTPVEIAAERDHDLLRLKVANGGRGLSGGQRDRVFEPFDRGSQRGSEAPGFGLGLPFSRAVARAHGGDVALGAASSGRTEFVVTLPLIAWSPGNVDPEARDDSRDTHEAKTNGGPPHARHPLRAV